MSAICGILDLNGGPVARRTLGRMMAQLAHRGPDGKGAWIEGPVGLGHQMLHVTPESLHERQPAVDPAARTAVTFDGRLDNRDGLCETLGIGPAERSGMPDSALVLAAYAKWGERCPEHLIGDWAFAVWDGRKGELLCARDPMGGRTFYYHHGPTAFAFATEIKGVLAAPGAPADMDEQAVADCLIMNRGSEEQTIYRSVRQLLPAHALRVGPKGVQKWQYWRLDPERNVRLGSDREYVDAFRELVFAAVRDRLRSAFPVTAQLSGGMDSSTVASVAAQILRERGQRMITLSWAPAGPVDWADEDIREEIGWVKQWVGDLDAEFLVTPNAGPLGDMDRAIELRDEPPGAGARHLFTMMEAVHARGARVLMSGYGADELATSQAGTARTTLAREGRYLDLFRHCCDWARLRGGGGRYLASLLWHGAVSALPPGLYRSLRRCWPKGRPNPTLDKAFIHPQFAERMGLRERVRDLYDPWAAPPTFREQSIHLLTEGHLEGAARNHSHLGSAYGVEATFPFQDRRLLEFCLAVPVDQHARGGWGRYLIRRGTEGLLPPRIQWSHNKSSAPSGDAPGLFSTHGEEILNLIGQARSHPLAAAYIDLDRMERHLTGPVASASRETTQQRRTGLSLGRFGAALGLAKFLLSLSRHA